MPNALAKTRSPYLLQHQNNPVDWRPWGDEAFAEALRRDVPVFLSVGYSTCYWCHVMERESFEDAATAAVMNERFVCVKLDREERPDVDDAYMAAVQAFTGRGGWPMSVFVEPRTRKPFWAGTYLPPSDRHGLPSFVRVLKGMSAAWAEQREEVLAQAETLAEAARERLVDARTPVRLDEGTVARAASDLMKLYDATHGGFGGAPKFPQPVFLELLLAVRLAAGDDQTRDGIDLAINGTLRGMALGGMHDQIGGGFHRYSVDERWLVPHFEKMLYDNGQLLGVYARAARVYDSGLYRRTAERITAYLLREMRDAQTGAFFAAQDAEVDHREGLSYLWAPEEVRSAGVEHADRLLRALGLDRGPNFRDPHHPDEPASNVLYLTDTPERLAARDGVTLDEWLVWFDGACARLLQVRSQRKQPSTDFKVLAGWNGLAIGGLAEAGALLGDADALAAARGAADFVLKTMVDERGELLRCFALGESHTPAFLEDYAMLAGGLAKLSRAISGEDAPAAERYVRSAAALAEAAERLFAEDGGYFDTRGGDKELWVRAQSVYDGALPSGNSAMLHALIELRLATGEARWTERAGRAMAAVSGAIERTPTGAAHATHALLRLLAIDRAAWAATLGQLPEPTRGDAEEAAEVEVLAEVDEVRLKPDESSAIELRLRIADGYHVIAADPGAGDAIGDLTALRIGVTGGSGVKVYADYPAGTEMGVGELRLKVYQGEVDVPVVIERSGPWSGDPTLVLVYQACSDQACQRARTVELDIKIGRA